jgi:hypothetical protein
MVPFPQMKLQWAVSMTSPASFSMGKQMWNTWSQSCKTFFLYQRYSSANMLGISPKQAF